MAVRLAVTFDVPPAATIELQGPALDAYYDYMAEPNEVTAEIFRERLNDQCSMWTELFTSVSEWKHVD